MLNKKKKFKIKRKTKITMFILIIAVFFLLNFLNRPEFLFNKYVSDWEKMDFKTMYSMLSTENKSAMSEEQFADRYSRIYGAMGTNGIKIVPHYNIFKIMFSTGKVEIPFDFSMNTLAGTVKFTYDAELIKETQNWHRVWKVVWSQKLIYPDMGEGDQIYVQETKAQRGEIYDINGNLLAVNGQILSVGLIPGEINGNLDDIKKELNKDLGVSGDLIDKELGQSWVKSDSFVPIINIPLDNQALADKLNEIPGISVQQKDARVYPYKDAAAHLVGYINSQGQGVTGVEKIFDDKLRAKNGYEIYIQDSLGYKKETIAYIAPEDGDNVDLSIDINLQVEIYNEMKNESGCAVALNPKTGQVLAMVSTPSYDPNMFILGISDAEEKSLLDNPNSPFLNRFEQAYVPGSTFKPIIASIGLENGAIDPNKQVEITGYQWQPDKSWGNYRVTRVNDSKTKVDLDTAFEYSDNIYFAQAALKIGKENLLAGANKFGIGEKIPFDFPMKASQISDDGIKSDIQLADTGYGQGQVLVNPLQLALMYSAFLNDGNIIKPYLEVTSLNMEPQVWKNNVISKTTAETVLQGLIDVVSGKDATSRDGRVPGKIIGGKTGTAELKTTMNAKVQRQDGWFVGFNADNPELLMVMRIEGVQGRGGSHFVVPKVQKVMQEYFAQN